MLLYNKTFLILLILFILPSGGISQNTLGLTNIDLTKSEEGYNLLFPHSQPNVYLLNGCGEIVHQWEDGQEFRPGNIAYILENGNLLKAKKPPIPDSIPTFSGGGSGGIVELRDWDNNLLWDIVIMDSLHRAHHDIAPMPNGNVLITAWERMPIEEVVASGRDTSLFNDIDLWPDFILEMDPIGDSIVWEWHAWDHLIQDFDLSKKNYGVILDHPELIDINYDLRGFGGRGDWMHVNAIDYNEKLDQIIISVPYFNEIWILDHSTTTEQAKGHTGGNAEKGGDIIFRWGNPRAYQQGNEEDQLLFFQHDSHWIDDFVESSHSYYGSIVLFNNRAGVNYSTANILTPEWNASTDSYKMKDGKYLPEDFDQVIFHPDTFAMYSSGLSGVQSLNNENTLITVGRKGYTFEITPDNEIVWEYITPFNSGQPAIQGDTLIINDNNTFRMKRYPANYLGFEGKNLEPKGYIEMNPDTTFCNLSQTAVSKYSLDLQVSIYPNPASDILSVKIDQGGNHTFSIYNLLGLKMLEKPIYNKINEINIEELDLLPGIYLLTINGSYVSKVWIN